MKMFKIVVLFGLLLMNCSCEKKAVSIEDKNIDSRYMYQVNENTVDESDNFYLEVVVKFNFEENYYINQVFLYPKFEEELKGVKSYFKYNEHEQHIKYIEHVEYCTSWGSFNLINIEEEEGVTISPGEIGWATGYACATPLNIENEDEIDIESIVSNREIVIVWGKNKETLKIPANKIQLIE